MFFFGILLVIAGLGGGVKETTQQLNGTYGQTSLIALFGGPHVPYWASLLICLALIGIGGWLIGSQILGQKRPHQH